VIDSKANTDTIIYDGNCTFCQRQVARLRALDRRKRLSYISLHDPQVAARWPELTHEDLMRQMYVISHRGEIFGGPDAVRYLSRRLPSLWWLAPLVHVPVLRGLGNTLYRWVAQRRYQFGRNVDCENGTCSIERSTSTERNGSATPTKQ
jgi:predicted DCC family thiol-disulfide oxidoreductase YuxK